MIFGDAMSLIWAVPFLGTLLSIALIPLIMPRLWHDHYGKIVGVWSFGLVSSLLSVFGIETTTHALMHTLLLDYIPFIILLGTLFILSGGLWIRAKFKGSPLTNTALLGFGTLLASIIGTTGALVLLIRPLIKANEGREKRAHLIIFLIFLVGNIGGSLSPLGDPPLFLGYLNGIDFLWVTEYLFAPCLVVSLPLLFLFYWVDRWFLKRESSLHHPTVRQRLTFEVGGKINFLLLGSLVSAILLTSKWQNSGTLILFDISLTISSLTRDFSLLFLSILSWKLTPQEYRKANGFSFEPFKEVIKIFLCIFITVLPVLSILEMGENGPLGFAMKALKDGSDTPSSFAYFWATGLFSAFLDNAPTYLVFFKTAGGDPKYLMKEGSELLMAISCGAVFMGALSYIGNAPNFMAKVIAEEQGVKMPSFFVYIVLACVILLPLFILFNWIFFL